MSARRPQRSADGWAREGRRARSSSSLLGRRAGEAVSGHPAMFSVSPVFELGRLREGGGFPHGLAELAAQLLGCHVGDAVHLCAGSVRARWTVDVRAETRPAVVADVRWLPFRPGSLRWIIADPPYSERHAEAIWKTGKRYPTPAVLLRECAQVLQPGGGVALLHFVVPRLPAELERVGTYGITTGPGYRIRVLTIARKRADVARLV